MNWQIGTILVVLLACVVPGLLALIPRKRDRRIVKRDRVAERHRAIAKRGFKSRMRNYREYGL